MTAAGYSVDRILLAVETSKGNSGLSHMPSPAAVSLCLPKRLFERTSSVWAKQVYSWESRGVAGVSSFVEYRQSGDLNIR